MSTTMIIPLAQELADANYIDYLAIEVDAQPVEWGRADPRLEEILRGISLSDHDPDENGDIDADAFRDAVVKAIEGAGFKVLHASVGKMVWSGE